MSATLKIESGVQLLARLTKKPNIENFYPSLFQTGPMSGDIIEISFNSCTSHFLSDIICEALTCHKLGEVPPEVLIFDTDGNLNYVNLNKILRLKILKKMRMHLMQSHDKDLKNEIKNTLARLHVLNIYDATQLYTTIYNLENTLVEHPGISLIIFNTLTAFYWSEQGFKIIKMDFYTKSLINIIQKITKEHKTICVYTRPEYFCTNKESDITPAEIKYQIQLLDNKEYYQVIIKTSTMKVTKCFQVSECGIKWIK